MQVKHIFAAHIGHQLRETADGAFPKNTAHRKSNRYQCDNNDTAV